jgi:magnesium-transporting ATPase (P-type)
MENRPQSDDEIANEERRRAKLWNRTTLWGLLFWIAFALLLVLAFNFGIPERLGAGAGLSAWLINWFPMILLVFVWIAFLIYRLRFRPNPETLRPGVQRRLVDDYTKRQRWTLAVIIPGTLLLAFNQPQAPNAHGLSDWYPQAVFVGYMLLVALALVLGTGFLSRRFRAANADELSRALRSRAASVGYVVAMMAMGTDYLIYLFAPQMLASALPLSMAAAFIIPALYFLAADWRASRDG